MAKKKVTPQLVTQYKYWTFCQNGHTHWYECGVVMEPAPLKCAECGANVIGTGKESCNQA